MALHDHLERLLCLLTVAFVCSVLVGLEEQCVVKRHGRRAWSMFTLGLRRLIQAFTQAASGQPDTMLRLIERIFPSLRGQDTILKFYSAKLFRRRQIRLSDGAA